MNSVCIAKLKVASLNLNVCKN